MELRPEVFKRNRKDVLRIIKYRLVIRNYQIRKSNGVTPSKLLLFAWSSVIYSDVNLVQFKILFGMYNCSCLEMLCVLAHATGKGDGDDVKIAVWIKICLETAKCIDLYLL